MSNNSNQTPSPENEVPPQELLNDEALARSWEAVRSLASETVNQPGKNVIMPLRRRVSAFATGIASVAAVILVIIVTQQLPRDGEEANLKGPGGAANHFELTVVKKGTNNSVEPITGPISKDSKLTLRIQGASPGEKAVLFSQSLNDKPKLFSATLSVGENQGILLDSTGSPAEISSGEFEGKVRFCVAAANSTESLDAMKKMLPDLWALMPKSQCSEVTFQ